LTKKCPCEILSVRRWERRTDHLISIMIPWESVIAMFTALPGLLLAELASASSFRDAWAQSNWIDMVVVLGLLSGVFTGVGVGFYRSTALLLGSTIGLLLAGQFSVALSLTPLFSSIRADMGPLASQVLAGLAIFCSCAGVAFLTTMILRSFFDQTLRICDNVLGGLMGISLAGILLGVVFLGVFQWPDSRLHQPIRRNLVQLNSKHTKQQISITIHKRPQTKITKKPTTITPVSPTQPPLSTQAAALSKTSHR